MSRITHSVIVPVLNGARYVEECLASILPQLDLHDELIVVDNGSTDGTVDFVQAFGDPRIVVVQQPIRGTAAARNKGLAVARGDLISFQDHDDLWPPGRHEALYAALVSHPEADAAHGRQRVVFDHVDPDPAYVALDGKYVLLHSIVTAMFRRALLDRTGPLDESMGLVADVDYLVRLRKAGMVAVEVDADVHIRRRHDSNSSQATVESVREHSMSVIRRNLQRKRGGL